MHLAVERVYEVVSEYGANQVHTPNLVRGRDYPPAAVGRTRFVSFALRPQFEQKGQRSPPAFRDDFYLRLRRRLGALGARRLGEKLSRTASARLVLSLRLSGGPLRSSR